jgi:hypothetical protein
MTTHKITVSPSKNAKGEIEWTMTYGNQSGKKEGEYPRIDLKHGAKDQRFQITLDDPTLGIKFSNDPLWIKAGCYPTSPGIDASQIEGFKRTDTVIKFLDLNKDPPVSLWYRLNFDVPGLKAGDKGTYLDPEIRNGGGGGKLLMALLAVAGAAAAVAISYVVYEAYADVNR